MDPKLLELAVDVANISTLGLLGRLEHDALTFHYKCQKCSNDGQFTIEYG